MTEPTDWFSTELPEGSLHGIRAFADERRKQVVDKDFTPYSDLDKYDQSALTVAALCYLDYACSELLGYEGDFPPYNWPWSDEDWKPREDLLENIQLAGGLLAAAYDRIVNEGQTTLQPHLYAQSDTNVCFCGRKREHELHTGEAPSRPVEQLVTEPEPESEEE